MRRVPKKWYAAKLLSRVEVDDHRKERTLLEESIRILRATDERDASARSEALGRAEQVEYENFEGRTVRWRFVKVLEIQDLSETKLSDGMEVFSRLRWAPARQPASKRGATRKRRGR